MHDPAPHREVAIAATESLRPGAMRLERIEEWLREEDPQRLAQLWQAADRVRREQVGDAVHLRGLIELSNCCVRSCAYCGISRERVGVERYRMRSDEVIACAHQAVTYGYGTVVLQAGEDYGLTRIQIADIVHRIKQETPLAVTLSLGERPYGDLVAWREAGADRYLLRFETSKADLYRHIHPDVGKRKSRRLAMLGDLREIGYEIGSGVMIGIPGQTWRDLARDLQFFRELDLDMIGVGPYLPHPETPLGREDAARRAATADQVPNSEAVTYRVVALARLLCPWANIPATTALATVNTASGREHGLERGANVVMPNLTPQRYRAAYEIYPAKACIDEQPGDCHVCMLGRIRRIGRQPGRGRGDVVPHRRDPPVGGAP